MITFSKNKSNPFRGKTYGIQSQLLGFSARNLLQNEGYRVGQFRHNSEKGQTLLEALIAIVIIGIMIAFSFNSLVDILRGQIKSDSQLTATRYALENLELVYHLYANAGFDSLNQALTDNPSGIFYPDIQPDNSMLETNPSFGTVDGIFHREIQLSYAQRADDFNLVETGGTANGETIKAVSRVSWPNGEGVEFTTYLTDLENN